MKYLIASSKFEFDSFLTTYYQSDMFNSENGMVVYDLEKLIYTIDGKEWKPIIIDHL